MPAVPDNGRWAYRAHTVGKREALRATAWRASGLARPFPVATGPTWRAIGAVMSDVFISYSRRDIAFARLIREALQQSQIDTWIDWDRIPVGELSLIHISEPTRRTPI